MTDRIIYVDPSWTYRERSTIKVLAPFGIYGVRVVYRRSLEEASAHDIVSAILEVEARYPGKVIIELGGPGDVVAELYYRHRGRASQRD